MSEILPRREVEITISGRSNSGKTTIAFLVYKALKDAGFEIDTSLGDLHLEDGRVLKEYDEEGLRNIEANLFKRTESVIKKTTVVIKQQLLPRLKIL